MKDKRQDIEIFSNRNFIRKWGITISTFNQLGYQTQDDFTFKKLSLGLTTNNNEYIGLLEPFFDKIKTDSLPTDYIKFEQETTRYDLKSKFEDNPDVDVMVNISSEITQDDFNVLTTLRLAVQQYSPGTYKIGNLTIDILKDL